MEDQTKTATTTAELREPEATPEAVVAQKEVPASEPKAAEGVATPVAIAEKKFTESEFNSKIQSILDGNKGTVDKMRKDMEALNQKVESLEDQKEQLEYDNWLQLLKDKGLDDIDPAKSVVEREKSVRKATREHEREQRRLEALRAELNQAGQAKAAYDLAKQFELGEAVVPELLKSENEYAMRAKALELRVEQLQGKLRQPETPTPKVEKTKGIDLSKMSEEARMGWAMEQALK